MENFFNFIDKINKPIFILYDRSFIHINKYLLNSLGFTPQNRPASLTQIMDGKWKNRLNALKDDEELTIPLIMNGGKIKKYAVRVHPLEIENSEYNCFILSVKDVIDQNIDLASRIFSKIPFAAFMFTDNLEILRVNDALEQMKEINIKSFDDVTEIFKLEDMSEISNSDYKSYNSVTNEFELNIFRPLPSLSYKLFAGIITESLSDSKKYDISSMKSSISNSIKRLIEVQKLYGSQSDIARPIWDGIHKEINNLGKIKRDLETKISSKMENNENLIFLNNLVKNEIEVLKSNLIFRERIKLIIQYSKDLKPISDKYADVMQNILLLLDRVAEIACQSNNNELYIETIEEGDRIWLNMFMNNSGQKKEEKKEIVDSLKSFEKVMIKNDVSFNCNINKKNNIDLRLGFELH